MSSKQIGLGAFEPDLSVLTEAERDGDTWGYLLEREVGGDRVE